MIDYNKVFTIDSILIIDNILIVSPSSSVGRASYLNVSVMGSIPVSGAREVSSGAHRCITHVAPILSLAMIANMRTREGLLGFA